MGVELSQEETQGLPSPMPQPHHEACVSVALCAARASTGIAGKHIHQTHACHQQTSSKQPARTCSRI